MTRSRSGPASTQPSRFSRESSESGRKRDSSASSRSNSASTRVEPVAGIAVEQALDRRPHRVELVALDHDVFVIVRGGSVTTLHVLLCRPGVVAADRCCVVRALRRRGPLAQDRVDERGLPLQRLLPQCDQLELRARFRRRPGMGGDGGPGEEEDEHADRGRVEAAHVVSHRGHLRRSSPSYSLAAGAVLVDHDRGGADVDDALRRRGSGRGSLGRSRGGGERLAERGLARGELPLLLGDHRRVLLLGGGAEVGRPRHREGARQRRESDHQGDQQGIDACHEAHLRVRLPRP